MPSRGEATPDHGQVVSDSGSKLTVILVWSREFSAIHIPYAKCNSGRPNPLVEFCDEAFRGAVRFVAFIPKSKLSPFALGTDNSGFLGWG